MIICCYEKRECGADLIQKYRDGVDIEQLMSEKVYIKRGYPRVSLSETGDGKIVTAFVQSLYHILTIVPLLQCTQALVRYTRLFDIGSMQGRSDSNFPGRSSGNVLRG